MRINKSIILCLLNILLCFCLSGIAQAQVQRSRSSYIGSIDFRAVVLLHPLMADYSPNKQAFKIDASLISPKQLESSRAENKKQVAYYRAMTTRLQAQITQQHRNYEREMTKLSSGYMAKIKGVTATATLAVEAESYNLKRKLSETRHRSRLRSLGEQLGGATGELNKLEKVAFHKGYTTPEETRARFAGIINDVRQYVQHVARQKGLEVVLNSGYKRGFRELEPSSRQRLVPSGYSYSNVINVPFRPPDEEHREDMQTYVEAYYSELANITREWLRYEDSILAPFSGEFVETDIIMGGVDITADVLQAIFQRYKVNTNIATQIIRAATAADQ